MALTPDAVRRGVEVLVRLPRDKARPAVVVRSDLLSELSYATVLPITTDLRAGFSMRIDLAPTPENGLRAASQLMVDWPQTVRFSDMGQAIGRLDMATMQAITRQMAVALGIGSSGRSRRDAGVPVITPPDTPLIAATVSPIATSIAAAPGAADRKAGCSPMPPDGRAAHRRHPVS